MSASKSVTRTTIEGRELSVSNLEKILFPECRFTKGQLIDYYVRIADTMLPHLKERPLTMKRFPTGSRASSSSRSTSLARTVMGPFRHRLLHGWARGGLLRGGKRSPDTGLGGEPRND